MNQDTNCIVCGETNHDVDNCPYTHGGYKHDCDNTCPKWDDEPSDAQNPYAEPYDEVLIGHLRNNAHVSRESYLR